MRFAYFGTPEDAVPPLQALLEAGHDAALVVTQPDRRRGRGGELVPSPVKRAAEALELPVLTPQRAREVVDDVRASGAEMGVVVAFGQLLPVPLLDATEHGFVNVHFSLLPRWRGAAPVERALLHGDTETGVCIMAVEEGLDTGGVFACERTPIGDHETAGELRVRLVEIGARLLLREIDTIPGREPEPQVGEPTYAHKLEVKEFHLDPASDAETLDRIVRAGNPKPGAWLEVGGRRVKVLRAHAEPGGDGAPGRLDPAGPALVTAGGRLVLDEVQPAGKREMSGAAWIAGLRGAERVDAVE